MLTDAEFDLLTMFVEPAARPVARSPARPYAGAGDVFDRSIDVPSCGSGARSATARPALIKTVRNGGYQFAARVDLQDNAP